MAMQGRIIRGGTCTFKAAVFLPGRVSLPANSMLPICRCSDTRRLDPAARRRAASSARGSGETPTRRTRPLALDNQGVFSVRVGGPLTDLRRARSMQPIILHHENSPPLLADIASGGLSRVDSPLTPHCRARSIPARIIESAKPFQDGIRPLVRRLTGGFFSSARPWRRLDPSSPFRPCFRKAESSSLLATDALGVQRRGDRRSGDEKPKVGALVRGLFVRQPGPK
jgi:hypothetical protein